MVYEINGSEIIKYSCHLFHIGLWIFVYNNLILNKVELLIVHDIVR